MEENLICLMAFASGNDYVETTGFKRYIGIAPARIIAVNPTKEELCKIYNSENIQEPEYTKTLTDSDGKEYKQTRISFIAKTIAEKNNGIETTYKLDFFVDERPFIGSQSQKAQIIDKYGQTAWGTREEIANKKIPVFKNGMQANIDADYRIAKRGEADLTDFIKVLLNIPSTRVYMNQQWVPNTAVNPEDCLCRFENIDKIINGDVKELKSIVSSLSANQFVKIVVGVKTTVDNKQVNVVYKKVLPPYTRSYDRISKEIMDAQSNGGLRDIEFIFGDLQVFEIKPSTISTSNTAAPLANEAASNPWATTAAPTEAPKASGSEDSKADELPF